MLLRIMQITIGARGSPLSKAQVYEVITALSSYYPNWNFKPIYIDTVGDKDKKSSLREMNRSDFFTREIDELLQKRTIRLAIHSAKDLPDPLPCDLVLALLTKGINPSDSLVFRDNDSLYTLPTAAKIATSSIRREEVVKKLRSDLTFVDIRGTIEERLHQLTTRSVDGVVIAEAALIRLELNHLNRMQLPGETVWGQGKLALVVHKDDLELREWLKRCSI